MRQWDIRPNDGVGPLHFGMTLEEVFNAIGPPDRQRQFSDGGRQEIRDEELEEFNHCHYENGRLLEVVLAPFTKNVTLHGVDLFGLDRMKLLKLLQNMD